MSYFDSLSLFSDNFEQRVADPAELGRQLFAHRMEADYVKTAIVELGAVAQFKTRARKLTPAAKTLAGETAISWLFGVGGRASWGELSLTVKRAHKMAGNRNDRVLQKLEDAGVIVCTYHGRGDDRHVTVALSYDLWLPAEITCSRCGSSGAGGKCASWCPQTPREIVAETIPADDERELVEPPASTEAAISGVIRRGDGGSAIRPAIERKRSDAERESFLAELTAAGIVPGARVEVAGSYEGGKLLSLYRGTVFAVRPSGTLIVDDESERDGAGTPIRHYVSRAKKITNCRPRFESKLSETGAYARIVEDLAWLDRMVRLDPAGFAADHLGDVERQLRRLVEAVAEGTI